MSSNFDLIDWAKQLNIKLIVCSRDNIPRKLTKSYYIVNMSNEKDDGTHWVAFSFGYKSNFYFDSFGVLPPNEIISALKHNKNNLYHLSHNDIQNLSSDYCGHFCIIVCFMIDKMKMSFHEAIHEWNIKNTMINDKYVRLFFKKILNISV